MSGREREKRGRARWPSAEEHRLRKLWEEGTTAKEIAEELGRTVTAVKSRAKKLGVARPARTGSRPAEEDASPGKLRDEGRPDQRFARDRGRPVKALAGVAPDEALGLSWARPAPGPAPRCQYIGETAGDPHGWTVCGAPSVPGRSYCAKHAAICYRRHGDEEDEAQAAE